MRGWLTIIAKINGSLDLEKASCDLIRIYYDCEIYKEVLMERVGEIRFIFYQDLSSYCYS